MPGNGMLSDGLMLPFGSIEFGSRTGVIGRRPSFMLITSTRPAPRTATYMYVEGAAERSGLPAACSVPPYWSDGLGPPQLHGNGGGWGGHAQMSRPQMPGGKYDGVCAMPTGFAPVS